MYILNFKMFHTILNLMIYLLCYIYVYIYTVHFNLNKKIPKNNFQNCIS